MYGYPGLNPKSVASTPALSSALASQPAPAPVLPVSTLGNTPKPAPEPQVRRRSVCAA